MKTRFRLPKPVYALVLVLGMGATPLQTSPEASGQRILAEAQASVVNTAFKTGEKLVFRVHYGALTAGEVVLSVDPATYDTRGEKAYRIICTGRTHSAFEWFYKVRDEFYSFVSVDKLRPLRYRRVTREGDYRFDDEVTFNYQNNTISGVRGTFEMQPNTQDMISAFYWARTLNLRGAAIGSTFQIPTFIDDKVYALGLKVKGRETIHTPLGKIRTIKITPIVVSGRVFKGEEEMTIWVTDDANLLPVQIESPVIVGAVKCSLVRTENLRNPMTARIGN